MYAEDYGFWNSLCIERVRWLHGPGYGALQVVGGLVCVCVHETEEVLCTGILGACAHIKTRPLHTSVCTDMCESSVARPVNRCFCVYLSPFCTRCIVLSKLTYPPINLCIYLSISIRLSSSLPNLSPSIHLHNNPSSYLSVCKLPIYLAVCHVCQSRSLHFSVIVFHFCPRRFG